MIQCEIYIKINSADIGAQPAYQFIDISNTGRAIEHIEISSRICEQTNASFIIRDDGGALMTRYSLSADTEGYIVFRNTRAEKDYRIKDTDLTDTIIPIVVKKLYPFGVHSGGFMLRFDCIVGTLNILRSVTDAYYGNSITALKKVFEKRGVPSFPGYLRYGKNATTTISPIDEPSSGGTWYSFKESMIDTINYITEHSLVPNDLIFWAYDELQNAYVYTSLREQYSMATSQVVINASQTSYTTATSTTNKAGQNIFIYPSLDIDISSDIGESIPDVYQNNIYTFGYEKEVNSTTNDFNNSMTNMRGDRINIYGGNMGDISSITSGEQVMYGPMAVKRMHSPNTHPMHSFSADYRKFKLATFTKKISIMMQNTLGPYIGSFTSYISPTITGRSTSERKMDIVYSDTYFVYAKEIVYSKKNNFTLEVRLELMSDNQMRGYLPPDIFDVAGIA